MRIRSAAAVVLLASLAAACSGGSTTTAPAVPGANPDSVRHAVRPKATSGGNVVSDPGFESGGFADGWSSCGTVAATVTTAEAHSGSYSALSGSTKKPEINGTAGVCQTIVVPADATLTFWVYEGTDDSVSYADQEADLLSTSGSTIANLFKEATTTNGWVERSYSLSAYAGETVKLYFGVKGNGYSKDYVYQYVDDVSVIGSGGTTPTPSPTASPTSAPTTSPTASPTAKPTATPTAKPTATPTSSPTPVASSSPYPCNDSQFVTDQSEFASGKISADQLVDVCGSVTSVLPSKVTSSGNHGYFYVSIPGSASPGTIEIVSNLDAMAEAPSGDPPAWPWVATGDYVYVQGRYYYDNSSSQGIDWTEDDTDSSWEHTGYVAVCSSVGAGCIFYQ
ncbi:MAG TPA: hypothetical protein VMH02_06890 [Verrucomicrobiae bacterium]|nr:hypothetical protein [Verrucomicrobiae bacterium]